LLADGLAPVNPSKPDPTEADGDGGGGGGAGGTIILNVNKVTTAITAEAKGGKGSNADNIVVDCMGPGGGGGAGVIWSSGASFPATVTTSVTGGTNGVVAATAVTVACRGSSNGATPGASGLVQSGYTAPIGSSPACTVLAASELAYFEGALTSEGAKLDWKILDPSAVSTFYVERSVDQAGYETIGTVQETGSTDFSYNDLRKLDGTVFYRLRLVYPDGTFNYSKVLPLTRYSTEALQLITLGPNPAGPELSLSVFAKKTVFGDISIVSAYGQRLYTNATVYNPGYNRIQVPLSHLAAGVYFLIVEGDNTRLVKRIVKLHTP
jgi:hypothetical protein